LEIFVLVSGSFSILATLPLIYLALQSFREGRELRRIQLEVAALMVENKRIGEEIRDLQQEMHVDQRHARSALVETQQTVERVAQISAPRKRRRLPRIRVELVSEPE